MSLKNIIICGDSRDKKLTDTIISACRKIGGVFVSDSECIYTTDENPLFCITCTDRIKMNDADKMNASIFFINKLPGQPLQPKLS